jgi:glyoxylase-like metal-dependent hydrolase (beta-lactamase superfamily II)
MKRAFVSFAAALLCVAHATHAAPVEKPALTKPRIYVLDCGSIQFENIGFFSDTGGYDGRKGEFTNTCVLVGHAKGWLLWDTGLKEGTDDKAPNAMGVMAKAGAPLTAQLASIGLKPKDVTYLALSHTHFDHTGNAGLFAESEWLMRAKEMDWALGTDAFATDTSTLEAYKNAKKSMIVMDHDVFGDGSVMLLSAPGHTPGHQVLLVKLASGNWIFSGDLYHQLESRLHGYVPTFNTSRAETQSSMDRVEKLVKHYKATFVVQHDKKSVDSLPHAPKFVE